MDCLSGKLFGKVDISLVYIAKNFYKEYGMWIPLLEKPKNYNEILECANYIIIEEKINNDDIYVKCKKALLIVDK